MPKHRLYPHGLPKQLTSTVWQVAGSLPIPLPRNMTIVRLPSGGLLLYSVVAMDDAGMAALEKLGKPEYLVVPMPAHTMDAPFYRARYPDIKLIAAPDARAALAPTLSVDGGPEVLTALGIRHHLSVGLKWTEIILDLDIDAGRALVFADVFTVGPKKPPLIMRLMGPPGGAGMPRIVKLRQLRRKPEARAFMLQLAKIPALSMLLCSHGPAVQEQAASTLQVAAERL